MYKKLVSQINLLVVGALFIAALAASACQAVDRSVASAAAAAEPLDQEAVADRIRFQDMLAERQSNAGGLALTTGPVEMSMTDRIRFHDSLLETNPISIAERIQFHDRLWELQIAAAPADGKSMADRILFHDQLEVGRSDQPVADGWSMAERIRFQDRLSNGS